MMNKFFFSIMVSLIGLPILKSQSGLQVDEETGRVVLEEVLDAQGDKATLYQRALKWFDDYYPNARVVVKEKDPDKGKITAKHKFMLQVPDAKGVNKDVGFIIYSFKIWVKDNMFRYKITDIHLQHTVYYGIEEWMDPGHEDAENNPKKISAIEKEFQELIDSLKKGMLPPKAEKDEDDW
jgi:Domain of unknown function (DUF4468) with TBP-like fold